MQRLKPILAPLLWPTVCLIAGLSIQHAVEWKLPWALVLTGLVFVALLMHRWEMVQSVLIGVCFIALGCWLMQNSEHRRACRQDNERVEPTAFDHLKRRALEWREGLLERYRQVAQNDDQYAVLAAMTLGDKSALTKKLRETYNKAGASHILALSGLHLGIVYMLLTMLMFGRRRKWLAQMVVILGIWAFALLTGLSVSIVRSASMLTLYAVFSIGDRRHSPFNLLCFTAIVMLLIDPMTLFDIGFQLSFLAVMAILLFMPLFDLYKPEVVKRYKLLNWLWGLMAVSTAAQLGVSPLIAFYFGRFPTYFLLTNLIVVPAATLIIYGALLVLIVPAAGKVLVWVVQGLNDVLAWLSQLPGASIEGLHPSVLQTILCYVLVAILYALLRTLNR